MALFDTQQRAEEDVSAFVFRKLRECCRLLTERTDATLAMAAYNRLHIDIRIYLLPTVVSTTKLMDRAPAVQIAQRAHRALTPRKNAHAGLTTGAPKRQPYRNSH